MNPNRRIYIERALLFLIAVAFTAAAVFSQWLVAFDLQIYDSLASRLTIDDNPDIVIVGIDQRTLDSRGRWPWPRERQAELVDAVAAAQPRAVMVDILYTGTYDPIGDRRMRESFEAVDTLALPIALDVIAQAAPALEVLPPVEFMSAVDVLGHVHFELDDDAIARGVYLYQGVGEARWPHVTLAIAELLGETDFRPAVCEPPAEFTINIERCEFYYVPFAGPPGTFVEVSALDVLRDPANADVLRDKLVLIGFTATGLGDQVTVPVSSSRRPMSGVEFNASLLNAIVADRLIERAPPVLTFVLALLFVAAPALALPHLRAGLMLSAAIGFALLPLIVAAIAFGAFQTYLPVATPAIVSFLTYPAWSWRRQRMAARFVEQELSRLQDEQQHWARAPSVSREAVVQRLCRVLGAELKDPHGDPRSVSDLHRDPPFSPAEESLIERSLTSFDDARGTSELPGERLAGQIRTLQSLADEVRTGKDLGLRGIEQMSSGVLIVSELGDVLFANSSALGLLGQGAAPGAGFEDALAELTMPLGQSRRDLFRNVVVERNKVDFETVIGELPVYVSAAPLPGSGEAIGRWLINVVDMAEVRAAQRDRDEALAFLSHDLRSPMLSVLASVRGGDDGVDIDAIERYTKRALAAGDQFVALSRAQAQEQIEFYDCELGNLVDNAVEQMFAIARAADIQVSCEIDGVDADDFEGIWVRGNGELLERAVINLVSNAIKYSDPGGCVRVSVRASGKQAEIVVADDGLGIPAEEVEQVFAAYYRSTAPGLAARRGAGLGLRFVKTVADRHGGRVAVRSQQGVGSTFTFTLPVSESADETEQ